MELGNWGGRAGGWMEGCSTRSSVKHQQQQVALPDHSAGSGPMLFQHANELCLYISHCEIHHSTKGAKENACIQIHLGAPPNWPADGCAHSHTSPGIHGSRRGKRAWSGGLAVLAMGWCATTWPSNSVHFLAPIGPHRCCPCCAAIGGKLMDSVIVCLCIRFVVRVCVRQCEECMANNNHNHHRWPPRCHIEWVLTVLIVPVHSAGQCSLRNGVFN